MSQGQQDIYACQQEATQMFPVNMVQQSYGSGYNTPVTTNCTGYGNQLNCTSTGGQHVAAPTAMVDVNANNRLQAQSSCMKARGYEFKMEFKK